MIDSPNTNSWRRVRIGDIADVIVSNVDKKTQLGEQPIRLCNYMDVYKNDFISPNMDLMQATATPEEVDKFHLEVADVLITKDSEDPTDIAVPALVEGTAPDLVCGYHLAIIRPGPQADGMFLKYTFDLPRIRAYFGSRANGATRFGLTVQSIKGAMIRVPDLAEQERIARTIRAWDDAINRSSRYILALVQQKKALMQALMA